MSWSRQRVGQTQPRAQGLATPVTAPTLSSRSRRQAGQQKPRAQGLATLTTRPTMCDRARRHSGLGPGEIPLQFEATDQSGLVVQCFSGYRALWDQALDSHLIDAQLGFFIRRSSAQTFDGRSTRIFCPKRARTAI